MRFAVLERTLSTHISKGRETFAFEFQRVPNFTDQFSCLNACRCVLSLETMLFCCVAVRPAESGCSSQPTPSTSGESRLAGQGFGLWTLATGVVYGLQPDALFVIIPALALPTKLAAAAYMGMFVAGTVAAMGSYTAIIGGLCLERPQSPFVVSLCVMLSILLARPCSAHGV